MIKIDDDEAPFQLQARTVRAFYSDGNVSDATVYSGFAMKENGDTLLQVELNETRNGNDYNINNNSCSDTNKVLDNRNISFHLHIGTYIYYSENGSSKYLLNLL